MKERGWKGGERLGRRVLAFLSKDGCMGRSLMLVPPSIHIGARVE